MKIKSVEVMNLVAPVTYEARKEDNGEYCEGKISLHNDLSPDMEAWIARHEGCHLLLEVSGLSKAWEQEFGAERAARLEEQVICQVVLPVLQTMALHYEDEAAEDGAEEDPT